ncbi:NUDIX hydrolase [Candidatus Woesearchaeota archaeon]|nr:NUDIX hydrolase [Candidatus Woesearchaeota archaeon]
METRTVVMGYIFHKAKVLLVKHKKSNRFMSCGGHLQENELFTEGLSREIKEETNLDIKIISTGHLELENSQPRPLIITFKIIPAENRRLQIQEYLCLVDDISTFRINNQELSGYQWLTKEEISNSNLTENLKGIILKAFRFMEMNNLLNQ